MSDNLSIETIFSGNFSQLLFQNPDLHSEAQKIISHFVIHCLQHDMKKLMALVYRIDITEKDIKAVVNNRFSLEINASQIADLILEKISKRKKTNTDLWQEC